MMKSVTTSIASPPDGPGDCGDKDLLDISRSTGFAKVIMTATDERIPYRNLTLFFRTCARYRRRATAVEAVRLVGALVVSKDDLRHGHHEARAR